MKNIESLKSELENLTSQKENLEKKIIGVEKELSADYSQYLNKWFKLYGYDIADVHYFKPTEIHYNIKYDWFDFSGPFIATGKDNAYIAVHHTESVEENNMKKMFQFVLDFDPLSEAKESFDKLSNKLEYESEME